MKWVVGNLASFPQIARPTIEGMLEDLRRRFERFGAGPHPYLNCLRGVLEELGEESAARARTPA